VREARYLVCGAAFKTRALLMTPPLIFVFLCDRLEWEWEWLNWAVGLVIFGLGLSVRVWAQRHLRYRLEGETQLAVTGPYVYVRNPVYIGNMLLFAAVCCLCELPWMVPIVVGWAWFVYDLAARFEEARLAKRFGQRYAEYCEKAPRWLPRLPRAPVARVVSQIGWLRVAAVEWQCTLLLLLPLVKEFLHPD
jgi:protein-S-isoprenylcysteine O-methyltransferase Ste14